MATPPLRTALSDTYPNPSNATMRTGMGVLWDYVTTLLGSTGDAVDAREALGLEIGVDVAHQWSRSSPIALSGQTSVEITGIPDWVTEVVLTAYDMSQSAAVLPLVRIGSASAMTTSGYTSASAYSAVAGGSSSMSSAGFVSQVNNAAYKTTVAFSIRKMSETPGSTTLCSCIHAGMSHDGGTTSIGISGGGYASTASGILSKVSLSVPSGTFDSGFAVFEWR